MKKHDGLQKRRAFTLVELLVVISIIGMLAALLLPAVQNAREAGRRAVCVNNQRQLGLATINYEGSNNSFPGYRDVQAVFEAGGSSPQARPVGWMFQLTPFMDRNDIYSRYGSPGEDTDVDANGMPYKLLPPNLGLAIAICPSDAQTGIKSDWPTPETGEQPKAPCSYVCNAGQLDLEQGSAVGKPRDAQPNGVFFDRFPYVDGISGGSGQGAHRISGSPVAATPTPDVKLAAMTTSFLTNGDGASTTLMFSENADCGNWIESGESMVGFNWYPNEANGSAAAPGPAARINGEVGLRASSPSGAPDQYFARPSSFHPSGVVVVFCDGHTTFLSDTIDYAVYGQLMSAKGKYSINTQDPGTPVPAAYKTPLDEGDY